MATMSTEQDRLVEQARGIAVSLDAELAMVASLVRSAGEQHLVKHNHASWLQGRSSVHCPACQLAAWAATA